MCRTVVLDLTPRQQKALVRVRDHDPKPHRREKAAAILNVADGGQLREVAALARATKEAAAAPGRVVLLYEDELTYYRRPSVARCHQPRGGPGAYAEQGHRSNHKRRVVGALDACSGRWHAWQGSRAGVK